MKLSLTDILVKCFVIYLFCTLFYNLIPFPATTIIGFAIVATLLVTYLHNLTKRKLYLLLYLVLILVTTSVATNNLVDNFSDFVKIATIFLLMGLLCIKKESEKLISSLDNNRTLLLRSAQVASIITAVMLVIPSCYAVETSWGESNRYFLGLAPSLHVIASCMCLYMAMYLYGLKNMKFRPYEMVFLLPPLLAVLQSGARVYLLCAAGVIFLYYYSRLQGKQIKYLLIPVAIVAGAYMVINSNIMNKFLFTQQGYAPSDFSALDKFTSGRTVFWMRDIVAFQESNLYEQLFGHGFTYILSVSGHTGHNDVLHMLLGIGVIGCVLYILYFVRAINYSVKKLRNNGYKKWISIAFGGILVLYIFSPMILNGIFGYQHLLYSIVILIAYVQGLTNDSYVQAGE